MRADLKRLYFAAYGDPKTRGTIANFILPKLEEEARTLACINASLNNEHKKIWREHGFIDLEQTIYAAIGFAKKHINV